MSSTDFSVAISPGVARIMNERFLDAALRTCPFVALARNPRMALEAGIYLQRHLPPEDFRRLAERASRAINMIEGE
jgi:hypothetical protein